MRIPSQLTLTSCAGLLLSLPSSISLAQTQPAEPIPAPISTSESPAPAQLDLPTEPITLEPDPTALVDPGEPGEPEADATVNSSDSGLTTPEPIPGMTEPVSQTILPLNGAADRIDVLIAPGQQVAAVGVLEEQAVELLDLTSGETLWRFAAGFAPSVVQIDAVNLLVYASGPNAPGLAVIDLKTGELVQGFGLASGALDIAVDTRLGRVFVTMPGAQSIAVIDLGDGAARNLPLPGVPLAVAYEPSRGQLLVTLAEEDPLGLLVVDPDNGELLARWRTGGNPEDLAIDAKGERVVVLNSGSQDLTVLDLTSNGEQIQQIGLDWRPTRLALSPDGTIAFVTSRDSDRLEIVSLVTAQQVASFPIGDQPTGIHFLSTPKTQGVLVVEAGIPQLQWFSVGELRQAAISQSDRIGAVTGQVLTIIGEPVQEGLLTIAPTTEFSGRQIEIEADGSFLLEEMPAGLYLVDVQVPGYPRTSTQIRVRSGFVSTQDIRLAPEQRQQDTKGIGILPDVPSFSDLLARELYPAISTLTPDQEVMLLSGPLGPSPEFASLAPLVTDLTLLDRDERYTEDIGKLRVIGDALDLRYVLLAQMQISQDYNIQGSSLLNTAIRFLAPVVPVDVPNFTPNQLRSRGVVVVVDLEQHSPGDQAEYYEAYGRDDVGGQPMYEDAAAGLFRLQVRNMVPEFVGQWQAANPFVD